MKLIKANLGRSPAALDLLVQTMEEEDTTFAVLSEPPSRGKGGGKWLWSVDRKSAVIARDRQVPVMPIGKGEGRVTIKIGQDFTLTSVYYSPNRATASFRRYWHTAMTEQTKLKDVGVKFRILAGDLNAWSRVWGSKKDDARGRVIQQSLAESELVCCNRGKENTFDTGTRGSTVDVTFASEAAAEKLQNWEVDATAETLSDHRRIRYRLNYPGTRTSATSRKQSSGRQGGQVGWNTRKLDKEKLTEQLVRAELVDTEASDLARLIAVIAEVIAKACDCAAPRRKSHTKWPQHWWNEEVANARKSCVTARRKLQRARRKSERPDDPRTIRLAERNYKANRKALKNAITRSKAKGWKQLIEEVDADPWGKPYKIVMGKLSGKTPPPTHPEEVGPALEKLFPS